MTQLKDIAKVQFSPYIQPSDTGQIHYFQAKHFDESGILNQNIDTFVKEDEIKENMLLERGDVIFISKGFRFFASLYYGIPEKAMASSIFFILKANTYKILPAFLTILLNQPQSIKYFEKLSAGSSIPSIRKGELEDFEFNLPTLENQQTIIKTHDLFMKELTLRKEILKETQIRNQSIINKLITTYGR
jgi:restriction endonuclease S subunit